jgi:hypothetical protein
MHYNVVDATNLNLFIEKVKQLKQAILILINAYLFLKEIEQFFKPIVI